MLSALSWLYGKIIDTRNSHFEKGTLQSYSLGAPTISVGNITVGGTGKTPLVALIAEILAAKGENVCVISRGYKRANEKERVLVSDRNKILTTVKQAGDEPFELAQKLIGKAFVIADADRVEAGKWAKETFGITVFILDDAFQHRKAKRDLDIVVIDATNPFGNRKPLPSGILREPLSNLSRADLIVVTRADHVKNITQIKDEIRLHNSKCEIAIAKNKTSLVFELADFLVGDRSNAAVPKGKALAFCALGNPDNFFDQLRNEEFELTATKAFPDHHSYKKSDIKDIVSIARESSAKFLFTTPKDAVKLAELRFELPCYVVESELSFDDEKKLRDQIYAVIKR